MPTVMICEDVIHVGWDSFLGCSASFRLQLGDVPEGQEYGLCFCSSDPRVFALGRSGEKRSRSEARAGEKEVRASPSGNVFSLLSL
jgi:hypothetical protein